MTKNKEGARLGKTVNIGNRGKKGFFIGRYEVTKADYNTLWVTYTPRPQVFNQVFNELGLVWKKGNTGVFVRFINPSGEFGHPRLCFCSTLTVVVPPKKTYTVEEIFGRSEPAKREPSLDDLFSDDYITYDHTGSEY